MLKIGHGTDTENGTGISVFLFDKAVPCAYHLCGSAPGTRDLLVIEADTIVPGIHALAFTGGSAFGLGAVDGVMQWLKERDRGLKTQGGVVPIVPAACIYDLGIKQAHPPSVALAYAACEAAIQNNPLCGTIGVGTGASVGKLIPGAQSMPGGFGYAALCINDITVRAYTVVNAVGDVLDAKGRIMAGAKNKKGEFLNCAQYILSGQPSRSFLMENTTLTLVVIDAQCDVLQLKRIAKMAQVGLACSLSPAFTAYDGDLVFAVAMGNKIVDELMLGQMAKEVVRQSVEKVFEIGV